MKNVRFYSRISFDNGPARRYDLLVVEDYKPDSGPGWAFCVRRPVETCGVGEPSWKTVSGLDLDEQGGTGGPYARCSEVAARHIDLALIKWYQANPRHACSACPRDHDGLCEGCHQREWCDDGCKRCLGQACGDR